MKLEQFVKQFISPHAAVTVRLIPRDGEYRRGADVKLGTGAGKFPEYLNRPALKEHRALARAEMLGVLEGNGPAEFYLLAWMETEEFVLLAGLIEAEELAGKTWILKEGEEK